MFTYVPRFIKFARVVKVPYYLSVYFNDFGLFYGLDNLLCYTNWTSYWLLIGQSELLLVGVLNMTRRRTRTFPQTNELDVILFNGKNQSSSCVEYLYVL